MDPDSYQIKLKYCIIRQDKTLLQLARPETPWRAEIGIFKEYLRENKE
jgi:hypothetical protein